MPRQRMKTPRTKMIQTAKEAIDDDWDSTRTRSINQTAASIDESLENEK